MHRTMDLIMKTKARKMMKNFEKYKTALERSKALHAFCGKNTCDKCALGNLNRNVIDCQFAWLDLEAEKDEPMDCPYCGGNIIGTSRTSRGVSLLCSCGYASCKYDTLQEAIEAHNRICRAVAAYNKSEVK